MRVSIQASASRSILRSSIYFEGLNRGRKRREMTPSDEPTVPWKTASVQWLDDWYTT
jgi:hypothetical protein